MSKEIFVPDIGDFSEVEIIEVLVSVGDTIKAEDSLISVESDKAAMEIPAPEGGTIKEIKVKLGDNISQGSLILLLDPATEGSTAPSANETPAPTVTAPQKTASPLAPTANPLARSAPAPHKPSPTAKINEVNFAKAHASPSIRKFAREIGVDLSQVDGSGRKGRITKDDVQNFVKRALSQCEASGGLGVAPMPEIDFSQWGEIESQPLTKINKLTGQNLHRNWVTIPHVTQFDEADITDLESFRKSMAPEYKDKGIKITMLTFLMKAVVSALKQYPRFNSSLDATGENLILKSYFNVGIAVDTPAGLVVPVVRDIDRKSLVDLAAELGEISTKARDKKLKVADMQGGSITISSLGGIGGTKFTPIVNAPEVAILGISRSKMAPVWNGKEFEPRLILPISLSYDHRVIDGADGARFTSFLSRVLSDTRRLLL
ncbi:Dihydrolipoamide acetyltransferase component of pyruvate dehydrogenase complex [hydrothermal vent metagenome]|uniref:Dihydrolipoyllysine-residue acetyltransferase component of pyruvate dehydrogenase complex n=1 Tax=hydrothermal vent metagenome TaxID=652676 RepID=A0A3B0ZBH7_9ZZZZ